MSRLLLFAGTAEGREIAEFCVRSGIPASVCVTTDYGAKLLPDSGSLDIRTERLDAGQMEALLSAGEFSFVVDATHPYAALATENIRHAAEACAVPYLRVLRESAEPEGCRMFRSAKEAADFLKQTQGNILLTTGSKELGVFTVLENFRERCFIRILDSEAMLQNALELGYPQEHIQTARGPFTEEQNRAHLTWAGAAYLVTKESGAAGGFPEKINAARDFGAVPLVIQRPRQEQGVSLKEAFREIERWKSL